MIRLTKAKSPMWLGNGMGKTNSEWVVADDPTIAIRNLSEWCAIKDDGTKYGKVIATASSKARLLSRPALMAAIAN